MHSMSYVMFCYLISDNILGSWRSRFGLEKFHCVLPQNVNGGVEIWKNGSLQSIYLKHEGPMVITGPWIKSFYYLTSKAHDRLEKSFKIPNC